MCVNIFKCFGWLLDILQRFLSFILAGVLCFALCCGIIITLGAGIAYGYNVSVVEFLDLKKSDITVYVRRGQFGDKPPFKPPLSRKSGDEPDMFSSNYSVDYQDQKLLDNSKPLSDAWQKAQDTSNYADKLTKYSKMKSSILKTFPKDDDGMEPQEESSAAINPVQFMPNPNSTLSDQPKMRHFLPDYRPPYTEDSNREIQETQRSNRKHKHKNKADDQIEADESQIIYLQPNASKYLYRREDFEDGDEDSNSKPV